VDEEGQKMKRDSEEG